MASKPRHSQNKALLAELGCYVAGGIHIALDSMTVWDAFTAEKSTVSGIRKNRNQTFSLSPENGREGALGRIFPSFDATLAELLSTFYFLCHADAPNLAFVFTCIRELVTSRASNIELFELN